MNEWMNIKMYQKLFVCSWHLPVYKGLNKNKGHFLLYHLPGIFQFHRAILSNNFHHNISRSIKNDPFYGWKNWVCPIFYHHVYRNYFDICKKKKKKPNTQTKVWLDMLYIFCFFVFLALWQGLYFMFIPKRALDNFSCMPWVFFFPKKIEIFLT